MKKCIIFGAGAYGKSAFELLSDDYKVIAFSDNDSNRWGKSICGTEIINPEDIVAYSDVEVVIANKMCYSSIADQLRKRGISAKVFLPYYEIHNMTQTYRLTEVGDFENKFNRQYLHMQGQSVHYATGNQKRILLIANLFPPQGGGGVQRPIKFVKYLKKYDYDVSVVTKGYCEGIVGFDKSLTDEIKGFDVIRIQDYPMLFNELSEKSKQEILGLYMGIVDSDRWMNSYLNTEPFRLIPEYQIIWVYNCLKELNERIEIEDYSCVITTLPPNASSILGFYLKKRYNLKWIVDYRDPWCMNRYALETYYSYRLKTLELEKELETRLAENADYIVTAGEEVSKGILYNTGAKRIACITNGYDENDFDDLEIEDKPYFEILHNGGIFESREPVPFLEIINELIDSKLISKDKIRLTFNGLVVEPFYSELRRVDRYNIIGFNGYISHTDSLRKAYNSDVLLLFGSYGDGAYLMYTGKIFELLRIGKPILSFSSPYGLHYEMIEERGRGITATYDDKEKIRDFILTHYDYWKKHGCTVRYEVDEFVKRFNRERLTGELAKVLDSVRGE